MSGQQLELIQILPSLLQAEAEGQLVPEEAGALKLILENFYGAQLAKQDSDLDLGIDENQILKSHNQY